MKALYALLIILFLSKYTKEGCSKNNPANINECTESELSGDEYRCCFLEYNILIEYKNCCLPLTEEDYSNTTRYLEKYVENIQKSSTENVTRAFIYCSSDYVVIPMLSLILLLL